MKNCHSKGPCWPRMLPLHTKVLDFSVPHKTWGRVENQLGCVKTMTIFMPLSRQVQCVLVHNAGIISFVLGHRNKRK